MSDKQPERLPPGTSYEAPRQIVRDPGALFSYVVAVCYGRRSSAPAALFGVTRQAFWGWRHPGKGVPGEHRDMVQKLLDDPKEPFRLPTNASITDLMRVNSRGGSHPVRPKAIRNDHLLNLLDRICTSGDAAYGRGTLYKIIDTMSRTVRNPFIFYRWGYLHGGIPSTYAQSFISALAMHNISGLYDLDYPDFEAWVRANMLAPEDDEALHGLVHDDDSGDEQADDESDGPNDESPRRSSGLMRSKPKGGKQWRELAAPDPL